MIVIDKNKLNDLLEALNQSYQVIVPAKKADLTQFMPLDSVKENGAEIILNENTVLSPKWLYLPQSEGMYAFWAKNKKLEIVDLPSDLDKMRVVFPVRHCDVQGIACLDKVFLDERHVDPQYLEKREKTIVMALMCNNPKDSCFCESMGVDRAHANNTVADVQVYDLGSEYAFEALNEKGQKALEAIKTFGSEKAVNAPEVKEQKIKVNIEGLPEKLSGMFYDSIWDSFMFKCIGCGTCAFICPTCYCFDINNKIRGEEGVKLRTWDSCMFDEYMLMAGGHNPRPGKKERVRNRFLHKLEYFYENYQMMLCTGCGRCLRKCPMNVDIVKFINQANAK